MNHRQAQNTLFPLLKPVSLAYAAAMRLRAAVYAKGFKSSSQPKSFCLSVGNISWGGSGKTPLAGQLLDWAAEANLKAVVLTRGYGGKASHYPLLVGPDTPAAFCGDEPRMLANMHPEAAIIVDPQRRRGLAWAEAKLPADLYILDDGMQHLAVRRDLNLVLLKPEDLQSEWNRVIPAGSWREDKNALRRADAFLLRVAPQDFPALAELAHKRLQSYQVPLFCFDLQPQALLPIDMTGHNGHTNLLGNRPYALCTAVGTPASVRRSAAEFTGQTPEREFIFPDHHAYSAQDLAEMNRAGLPLVCTAKDAVKLWPLLPAFPQLEVLVLQAGIVFGPSLFIKDTAQESTTASAINALPLFRRWLAEQFERFGRVKEI